MTQREWRLKYTFGNTPISKMPWVMTYKSVEIIKNIITKPNVEEVQWKTKGGKINSIKHRVF
jgi:hypothetical protein